MVTPRMILVPCGMVEDHRYQYNPALPGLRVLLNQTVFSLRGRLAIHLSTNTTPLTTILLRCAHIFCTRDTATIGPVLVRSTL